MREDGAKSPGRGWHFNPSLVWFAAVSGATCPNSSLKRVPLQKEVRSSRSEGRVGKEKGSRGPRSERVPRRGADLLHSPKKHLSPLSRSFRPVTEFTLKISCLWLVLYLIKKKIGTRIELKKCLNMRFFFVSRSDSEHPTIPFTFPMNNNEGKRKHTVYFGFGRFFWQKQVHDWPLKN